MPKIAWRAKFNTVEHCCIDLNILKHYPSHLYQSSALPLTIAQYSLFNFQTACKMMSCRNFILQGLTTNLSFRTEVPSVASVVQRRAGQCDRNPTDPRWRHSNPDSHYGFRTTSFLQSGQMYHYQQQLYPQQQPQQQQQLQWRYEGMDSHYALPEQLPRYLWGPPPPYSQPPSLENIREAAATTSTQNLVTNSSNASGSLASPTSPTDSSRPRSQPPPPPLARTTKSGLLVSSSSDYSLNSHINNNKNNNSNSSNNNMHSSVSLSAYDESVKSAVHVYEQVR